MSKKIVAKDVRKGSRDVADLYGAVFESKRWSDELPFLNFKAHWKVKVAPGFAGAVIRFTVKTNDSNRAVSVYFDGYDNLGVMDSPYWEMYPNKKGKPERFLLGAENRLLEAIEESLQTLDQ